MWAGEIWRAPHIRPRSRWRRSAIRRECARVRGQDSATRRAPNDLFFDNLVAFVLDIQFFSTIIYIWYEGGQRRPFLVRSVIRTTSAAESADGRLSVPGGSQPELDSRGLKKTQTKGGITDNGEESQGREEEGRQETVS